jgi:hypothetical protein
MAHGTLGQRRETKNGFMEKPARPTQPGVTCETSGTLRNRRMNVLHMELLFRISGFSSLLRVIIFEYTITEY